MVRKFEVYFEGESVPSLNQLIDRLDAEFEDEVFEDDLLIEVRGPFKIDEGWVV